MPEDIVKPTAIGSTYPTGWNFVGAASRFQAVTDDSDASYVYTTSYGDNVSFNMPALGAGVVAVNTVKHYHRCNDSSSASVHTCFTSYLRKGTDLGGAWTPNEQMNNVAWRESPTVLSPDGDAWTVADFNTGAALEIQQNKSINNGHQFNHIENRLKIDYSYEGSGWKCMIASLLGPVIGAHILWEEIPRLVAMIQQTWATPLLIHGHEAVDIFRALRGLPELPKEA